MTQTSCKRDSKSKSHPGMRLAPVRVFSCKHPLSESTHTHMTMPNVSDGLNKRTYLHAIGLHITCMYVCIIVNENRFRERIQVQCWNNLDICLYICFYKKQWGVN